MTAHADVRKGMSLTKFIVYALILAFHDKTWIWLWIASYPRISPGATPTRVLSKFYFMVVRWDYVLTNML